MIASNHPATVSQLAQQLGDRQSVDEPVFIEAVKEMARDGAIVLEKPMFVVESAFDYLFTFTLSGWLWATLVITIISLLAVSMIPNIFPLNIPKLILGSVFVIFLPGYSLLQLLFPKESDLDSLERFALIVGASLAVVPFIGLILNFTSWGIRLVPIVASLATFTITVSCAAAIRKYWAIQS